MIVLFPVCWPIAWILDKTLGEEMPTVYSKKELMKIVEEHEGSKESDVDADEERIIKGALSFSNKTAEQIMTPRTVVFALDSDAVLDKKLLNKIKKEGFTRIPVYKKTIDDTIGIIYAKDLINIKPNRRVEEIYRKEKTLAVQKSIKLDILLNTFIKSKNHLAFVQDEYKGLEGVVSLEDVLEEIIRQEIVDESDQVINLQKKAKNKKKKK